MPMKMCGPSSGPMKGIVAPSAASRTSSAAATAPVRRALPATPSRTSAAAFDRYMGRDARPRPLAVAKRSVRDLLSSASKPGSAKDDPGAAERRVLDPDPAAVQLDDRAGDAETQAAAAGARSRAASLRWKRSKTRSRSAGGMPGPSSSTVTIRVRRRLAPRARPVRPARRGGGRWRAGCGSTWAIRSGSSSIVPSASSPTSTPRAAPCGEIAAGRAPTCTSAQRRADALVEAGEGEQVVDQAFDPSASRSSSSPRPGAPPRRSGVSLRASTSSWPRIAVSGLRSSCEASETNCRCRAKASVEAVEHVVEGLGEGPQLRGHLPGSTRAAA